MEPRCHRLAIACRQGIAHRICRLGHLGRDVKLAVGLCRRDTLTRSHKYDRKAIHRGKHTLNHISRPREQRGHRVQEKRDVRANRSGDVDHTRVTCGRIRVDAPQLTER